MNSRDRRFLPLLLTMVSLCGASAFAAAPAISVFAPVSSAFNATVTITGTNFVAPVTVSFNGAASPSVTVVSSTSVKATVPVTATTGAITVTTSGGSATSASVFTVLPGMAATPVTAGPPTTALTLYYSGFGAREALDIYFDAGDIALSSASAGGAGNIAVSIPADARPGSHWITAVGRHSGSSTQIPFTVRASWPQLGFQPNHKAKNRYENILSASAVGALDEAWRTPDTGAGLSTPAVVNGIVYATFTDGSIRAFDEITGAQKFSYQTSGTITYSSPAVANGIVYAGSSDYYLYALDAVTGALKWRYATGNYVWSSPNVVNGIVYFGSYDNKIYALNATTGALIWSFATGSAVFSSPLVANGVVYVGSLDADVYALNAATGALIWQAVTSGEILASPVLVGGRVCIGSDDSKMYALDASTGQTVWTYSISGYDVESSAAADGGAIFFGDDNGSVYSLSSGGALRWSTALPGGSLINCPVCVADGVVYTTAGLNTYALDENTGALLTTLPVGNTYGGAIVVDGAVFAGDLGDGVLTRYTPNALLSNYVAPRPDPRQLRPHRLR